MTELQVQPSADWRMRQKHLNHALLATMAPQTFLATLEDFNKKPAVLTVDSDLHNRPASKKSPRERSNLATDSINFDQKLDISQDSTTEYVPEEDYPVKPGADGDYQGKSSDVEFPVSFYAEQKLKRLQQDNEQLNNSMNKLIESLEVPRAPTSSEPHRASLPADDIDKVFGNTMQNPNEDPSSAIGNSRAYHLDNLNGLRSTDITSNRAAIGKNGLSVPLVSVQEIVSMRKEVTALKESLEQAEKEKKQYSDQLQLVLTEYKLETESLRRELNQKNDKCVQVEKQLRELVEQNSLLTKEQVKLREEAHTSSEFADQTAKMSAEVSELLTKEENLRDERDILTVRCENLQAENALLRSANEELSKLREDQKLAERELHKQNDEIQQMQLAQEDSAKEHAQSMHNLQDALNDLKHNYQQQSLKYNDLLHEFNRLKSVVGEGSAHSPQNNVINTSGASPPSSNNLDQLLRTGTVSGTAVQTYGGPDIPTEPVPVTVYIAKYTYDPLKYSPNDNPELELCVTKGDYVYIHGDMDEDGFFEGELLGGQRGLVPSNFVEPVKEKELPELLKSHLLKLRNRSLSNLHLNQIAGGNYGLNPKVDSGVQVLEDEITDFPNRGVNLTSNRGLNSGHRASAADQPNHFPVSTHVNSRSPAHYYATTDGNALDSTALNHVTEFNEMSNSHKYSPSYAGSSPRSVSSVGTDDHSRPFVNGPSTKHLSPRNEASFSTNQVAASSEDVSPPKKMIIEKMLLNSMLISWSPSNEPIKKIDSYDIHVDGIKNLSVKPYAKLRALLHNIDTQVTHKVSIRTVTTRGDSSKDQQCTIVVGKGAKRCPYEVKAVNIQPTSAELIWWPSNSNFAHGLCVNQGEEIKVPSGTFRWTLNNLTPSSVYKVALKSLPEDAPNSFPPANESSSSPSAQSSTVSKIEFKTLPTGKTGLSGGLPDCPSSVRVSPSASQSNTLVVTWQPVVADSDGTGTSNGALVTGYQVAKETGEVLVTIPDPTADRALLSFSSLRGAKRISVRTTSYNGASIDSKPVKLPQSLSTSPRTPGTSPLGGGTRRSAMLTDGDLQPDYLSETSEVSELTDILEESEMRVHNRTVGGGSYNLESVNVPSVMPTVYDYQQYLKEPKRQPRTRPRIPPPHSQLSAHDKAYTSDSELTHTRPSYRNTNSLRSPGSGFRDDDLVLYHNSPSRLRGSGRRPDRSRVPQSSGRWKKTGSSHRYRYFVALYNYNPLTMSPNKDTAHEEIGFREADVIKVYGDKDEDEFYFGETRDGLKGFVPSNMVMELSAKPPQLDSPDQRLRERASVNSLRKMVALFDYDPRKASPNPDAEDVELSFRAGDLMYVFGNVDEDGFYVAELQSGQRGLVPSNFLEEVDDTKYVPTRGPPRSSLQPPRNGHPASQSPSISSYKGAASGGNPSNGPITSRQLGPGTLFQSNSPLINAHRPNSGDAPHSPNIRHLAPTQQQQTHPAPQFTTPPRGDAHFGLPHPAAPQTASATPSEYNTSRVNNTPGRSSALFASPTPALPSRSPIHGSVDAPNRR